MLKHQPDGSPDLHTPHMEHQDEQFQFQTIRGLCGGYSMLERRDNIWFWWCVFLVRPLSHRHNKYQHVFLTIGPFFLHVTSSYLVACLKNYPQMTSEMTLVLPGWDNSQDWSQSGFDYEVSWNGGTPTSSILDWDFHGFSLINHPAIGDFRFMETSMWIWLCFDMCKIMSTSCDWTRRSAGNP
jgi:hypothetical protein